MIYIIFTYAHINLPYKINPSCRYLYQFHGWYGINDQRFTMLCFCGANWGDGCYKIPNVPASIWPQTAGVDISSEWKSTTTIKTVVILELFSRNASLKLYLFQRLSVRWSLDPQGVFPRKCPEHSGLGIIAICPGIIVYVVYFRMWALMVKP